MTDPNKADWAPRIMLKLSPEFRVILGELTAHLEAACPGLHVGPIRIIKYALERMRAELCDGDALPLPNANHIPSALRRKGQHHAAQKETRR